MSEDPKEKAKKRLIALEKDKQEKLQKEEEQRARGKKMAEIVRQKKEDINSQWNLFREKKIGHIEWKVNSHDPQRIDGSFDGEVIFFIIPTPIAYRMNMVKGKARSFFICEKLSLTYTSMEIDKLKQQAEKLIKIRIKAEFFILTLERKQAGGPTIQQIQEFFNKNKKVYFFYALVSGNKINVKSRKTLVDTLPQSIKDFWTAEEKKKIRMKMGFTAKYNKKYKQNVKRKRRERAKAKKLLPPRGWKPPED